MEEVKQEHKSQVRTFQWEPRCFKKNGEQLYTGHLIIKAMTGLERNKILAEDGIFDVQEKISKETNGKQSEWLLGIYEKRKHLILGSEVIREKDGAKLSLEDVEYEEPLWGLPLEFALGFVNGFTLGNGSRPASEQNLQN